MKRANCRKCFDVEINEFLIWDTDDEGNAFLFFCFFVLFFGIVNCIP